MADDKYATPEWKRVLMEKQSERRASMSQLQRPTSEKVSIYKDSFLPTSSQVDSLATTAALPGYFSRNGSSPIIPKDAALPLLPSQVRAAKDPLVPESPRSYSRPPPQPISIPRAPITVPVEELKMVSQVACSPDEEHDHPISKRSSFTMITSPRPPSPPTTNKRSSLTKEETPSPKAKENSPTVDSPLVVPPTLNGFTFRAPRQLGLVKGQSRDGDIEDINVDAEIPVEIPKGEEGLYTYAWKGAIRRQSSSGLLSKPILKATDAAAKSATDAKASAGQNSRRLSIQWPDEVGKSLLEVGPIQYIDDSTASEHDSDSDGELSTPLPNSLAHNAKRFEVTHKTKNVNKDKYDVYGKEMDASAQSPATLNAALANLLW